jgi:iron complex transport system permease protein
VLLALATLGVAVAYLTVGIRGPVDLVLMLRGRRLAAICVVAVATGVSTVIFQTISGNRLLTPSIMGFDALYVLVQTVLVFAFGSLWLLSVNQRLMFVLEAGLMVAFALTLYRWLFLGRGRSLHMMLLVGVVLGLLFRSVTNLLQRMIDPNEFVVLQERLFASFNGVAPDLLAISALVLAVVLVLVWRLRDTLDVLLLGRDQAIGLGVDHRRTVSLVLLLVALQVAVATALVGPLNGFEPISFFGLLVATLAHAILPGFRHRHLLPAAAMLAVVVLAGGQLVLEQLLGLGSTVGIVTEFAGGIVFILMLLKGIAR